MKLKKKDKKSFQFFLFLISIFLIAFLIVSNLKIEKKRNELKKEIENLNSGLQLLKERNEELKKLINKTKSESYWEEKAREEGYAREGEEVIVIKKVEERKEEKKPETIWQRMIKIFQK